MRILKLSILIGTCLVLLLPILSTSAQEKNTTPADPEVERVQAMSRQAWQEAEAFTKTGVKETDENYPGRKWAATFWEYREQHPGTPASGRATGEALHLLVHAGLISEVLTRADALKADDPAWKYIFSPLQEAAGKTKDYSFLLSKTQALLEQATDKEIRARALHAQGNVYQQQGETKQAQAAWQAAIAEQPGTRIAEEAERKIYETSYLNLGQQAPLFAAKAINGATVSLADYKGKVVLLTFWATWCSTCVGEIPQLKDAYAKYKNKGLVILGVSMDEKLQPLQEMVALKGIAWPQFFDGKKFDSPLAKLYNVKSTPALYLLDRQGKMAARDLSGNNLADALAQAMQK